MGTSTGFPSYMLFLCTKKICKQNWKESDLWVCNKAIRFINHEQTCIYWPGKEAVLTLCAPVKHTSMCRGRFPNFFFCVMCLHSSSLYNPTMHYPQEATLFLSLRRNNFNIFSLDITSNRINLITLHILAFGCWIIKIDCVCMGERGRERERETNECQILVICNCNIKNNQVVIFPVNLLWRAILKWKKKSKRKWSKKLCTVMFLKSFSKIFFQKN